MNSDAYIYANSRIAALESELLSASQLERMMSAKTADEAFLALNNTFLAPYIAGGSRKDLPRMLRKSVSATKHLITQIVPDEDVLAVLWLRYDFYNLKVIVKGYQAKLSKEEILELCFHAGVYMPDVMIDAVAHDTVSNLLPELGQAYAQAQEAQQVYEIDFAMNRGYFAAVRAIAAATKEPFVHAYVTRIIDLFNLGTQLRLLMTLPEIERDKLFVTGGSFTMRAIATKEEILERYTTMGAETMWREAIATFNKTQNFAVLQKAADDALVQFVKDQATGTFSIVPVFGYFLAHRNNTQIVRTVIAAKESTMDEVELRRLLRKLYT